MSDDDVFIQAILDAPEDSAPRLVYADWLEERADPRAEYLRLLCVAIDSGGRTVDPRLHELLRVIDPKWVDLVHPRGRLVIPWFTIIREVAHGVLTTVYEAAHTHPNLSGRRVALKVLRHRRQAEQFLNSCRVHAALRHPHIPALYVVEESFGQFYAARQFVDGENLVQNIGRAAHTSTEVARITTAAASALSHCHGSGLVHGYVHPRHLLLDRDDSIWLIGFSEFPPGGLVGNPLHLAPEQLEPGGTVTPQTDVYLLAESAVWLLTGQHPFRNIPAGEPLLAAKRAVNPWASNRRRPAALPTGTESVLRRAMSPNPMDRYPTPVELAEAFAAAVRATRPRSRWRIW